MVAAMPLDSISLHGGANDHELKPGYASAVLVKLDDGTVQELRRAARDKDTLRFTTGSTPVRSAVGWFVGA